MITGLLIVDYRKIYHLATVSPLLANIRQEFGFRTAKQFPHQHHAPNRCSLHLTGVKNLEILTLFSIFAALIFFNTVHMEKKEIQEARIRNYFIQATKEILKGEGINSVSVRNIANHAGYSFATLYNYFRDVKVLISLCVKDFQDDCEAYVTEQTRKSKRGEERINAISWAYMQYFVEYPGIFELFYIVKFSDLGYKQQTIELITTFLNRLCEKEWQYCQKKKTVTAEEREKISMQLNFLTSGMLLNYLNRMFPENYSVFEQTAKQNISNCWKIKNNPD